MAKIRYYLDKRNKGAAVYPLKITIHAGKKTILLPTGLYLRSEEWDGQKVIIRPDREALNRHLSNCKYKIEEAMFALQMDGQPLTASDVKRRMLALLDPETANSHNTFAAAADAMLSTKKGRTKEIYVNTISKLRAYCDYESLTFDDVNVAWLERYVAAHDSERTNTTAIDLRNIRAIFNYARKNGLTKEYPFLHYRIQREKTRHRHIQPELICALRDFKCEPHQERYRDIFILIFYLIGINIVDLCLAKRKDVIDGRLEYVRHKTHKQYSILIQPEAQAIIDRYAGKEYLIDVMERMKDYKNFIKAINKNVQEIGFWHYGKGRGGRKERTPILPEGATTYWMRHSWATIAHRIGIDKDTISMALGHSFGVEVTDTYIDYDIHKVDEANRKVLDFLADISQNKTQLDLLFAI